MSESILESDLARRTSNFFIPTMKNRRNKRGVPDVRLRRGEIDSALKSIEWVEGSITEFPAHLMKRLKTHLKDTGNENFCNSYWSPGRCTLQTRGNDGAHFELANGTLITELGRFAYNGFKSKSQIVLVKIPHGKRLQRMIVPTKQPRILEYKDRKDHVAFSWKTWLPSTAQYKNYTAPSAEGVLQVSYPLKTPPTPASVTAKLLSSTQKESRQASLDEYKSYWNRQTQSQWSPTTTDSSDDTQYKDHETQRPQPRQSAPYDSYVSVGSPPKQEPAGFRYTSGISETRWTPPLLTEVHLYLV